MTDLFGGLPVNVSIADQIAEVRREIAMRRTVYSRRVAIGHMTAEAAERQITIMEEVAKTLEGVRDGA